MNGRIFLAAILLVGAQALTSGCNPGANPAAAPEEPQALQFDLFLAQLDSTAPAQRQALVDSFMVAVDSLPKPLVEDTLAVFVYLGNPSSPPRMPGDYNEWNPAADTMVWVDSTNFYYHCEYFPGDARLDYKFIIGNNWILDPLNPRTVTGGFGPNSELAMPDFVDPPEILEYPDLEHGTILTTTFHSEILNNTRTVRIYLPPDYSYSGQYYPAIYVHDGGEYLSLASMDNVLDYCIAHDFCQPVIAVFIDPVNRNEEYWLNDDFRRFMVEEMVPYIDGQYHTHADPEHRATMGASLGGVTSIYLAYENPETFGLAGGQSSALWINDDQMIQAIENGPAVPVKFYLDCGTFETSNLEDNRRLSEALAAQNYFYLYNEYHDGHSWGNWRGHIDNILETLFPPPMK